MPNTQQELDSVKQHLAIEWARLAKVRAAFEQAEAPGNEQRLKELEQREGDLLAVIKELQVKENRLSSQLAGGSSTAGEHGFNINLRDLEARMENWLYLVIAKGLMLWSQDVPQGEEIPQKKML